MSETLSQTEIDALLNDAKSGEKDSPSSKEELESKKIRHYDFSKPNIFGRDQLKMLNMIHDDYGNSISGFLTRYLHTPFLVDLVNLEVLTYKDFINSLSTPSVLSIIDLKPLKGSMVLDLPPAISTVIIDSVLGGLSDPSDQINEFTEIELSILRGIVEQLTEAIKESWGNITTIQPSLERMETNPQMIQIASPVDTVILATYKSSVNEVDDFMKICIPHQVIEPIADNLSTKKWPDQGNENTTLENDKDAIKNKIMSMKTEVRVELGKNTITLGELTNLQAGDVISLGKNINSNLELYIGDSIKFRGKPGIQNSKYSIEISEIIKNNRQV
jgi:flagellar motor switch protein FliM